MPAAFVDGRAAARAKCRFSYATGRQMEGKGQLLHIVCIY
jgi:hypothetical protein